MIKKKWSKAEERAYWKAHRDAYIEMKDRMLEEPGYEWRDPLSFYGELFGDSVLQEKWVDAEGNVDELLKDEIAKDGKPNGIALKFGPDTCEKELSGSTKKIEVVRVRRYTITDDLEGVSELVKLSLEQNAPCYMAPVSWFGKKNIAKNARLLHAFAIDLDGVTPAKLGTVLKQMRNGHDASLPKTVSMPQASYVVMSGTGLHLYYLLDRPVPLVPAVIPFLQELKRRLTDVVWTDYTSELGNNGRQYQGIYQAFRMPGTTTKLNGHGIGDKLTCKYEAVAFAYVPKGRIEPFRSTIGYLVDYCGIRGKKIPEELRLVLETRGGRTPLAEAKEKWPEWYERVRSNGEKGAGGSKRVIYDSWLGRIEREAVVHGRYFAVLALVAYAMKCDVPYEELARDAYGLVDKLDSLSDDPGNRFTSYDVSCALESYGDRKLIRWRNDYMCRRAMIEAHSNKRNGREQSVHLAGARAVQAINDKANGTDWRDGNGRKPKADLIRSYAAEHPDASHSAIAKALGVSRTTVIKWLREPLADAEAESAAKSPLGDKLRDAYELVKAHAMSGEIEGGQASIEYAIVALTGGAYAAATAVSDRLKREE